MSITIGEALHEILIKSARKLVAILPPETTRQRMGKSIVPLTFLIILGLWGNVVKGELFCPPAKERASYKIIGEIYDLPVPIEEVNVSLYSHGDFISKCAIKTSTCDLGSSTFTPGFSFSPIGDNDLQMTLTYDNFSSQQEGVYRVEWDFLSFTNTSTCTVSIGQPVDECSGQPPPCVRGNCTDLDIGYTCKCQIGYAGQRCTSGNYMLYCQYNEFTVSFSSAVHHCTNIPIGCYIASLDQDDDLQLTVKLDSSSRPSSYITWNATQVNKTIIFEICIQDGTPSGLTEFLYSVNNAATPRTSFRLNMKVQVINDNVSPIFNSPSYNFNVSENALIGDIIVYVNKTRIHKSDCLSDSGCVLVVDPNIGLYPGVDSLAAVLGWSSHANSRIDFQPQNTSVSVGYFYVSRQLTSRSETFLVQVSDGWSSPAEARFVFQMLEVRQAPVCNTSVRELHLDIRQPANSILANISCFDADTSAMFIRIEYVISGQYAAYFNVTSVGQLVTSQSLLAWDPGILTFDISVTGYSRTPDDSFNSTIPVRIDLDVPTPDCILTIISFPIRWEIGSVAQLNLTCQIYGIDKLTAVGQNKTDIYTLQGRKTSTTMYMFDLTLEKYMPGYYQVVVFPSLGKAGASANATVVIAKPPIFNIANYNVLMNETAPVNTAILKVSAHTDIPGATVTYSIVSYLTGMNSGYSFQVGADDGVVTLAGKSVLMSNLQVSFQIQALDNVTGYLTNATVNVTIIVQNKAPTCDSLNNSTVINSTINVGKIFYSLSCQDPDAIDETTGLLYNVTSDPPTVRVNISDTGHIILAEPLPVGVTSAFLTVYVSDKEYAVTVYINVSINVVLCPTNLSDQGVVFNATPANSLVLASCPSGYTGDVSRLCDMDSSWGPYSYSNCTISALINIIENVKNVRNSSTQNISQTVKETADHLDAILTNYSTVYVLDIKKIAELLHELGKLSQTDNGIQVEDETLKKFTKSANIVFAADESHWMTAMEEGFEGGYKLVTGIEALSTSSLRNVTFSTEPIITEHIAIKRGSSHEAITFPNASDNSQNEDWFSRSNNSVYLARQASPSNNNLLKYSVIIYRNIGNKFWIKPDHQNVSLHNKTIGTDILSFAVNTQLESLTPPLRLTFALNRSKYSDPVCGFLNTSSNLEGVWSVDGCTMENENVTDNTVTCVCTHLTNFAALVSPYRNPDHEVALSIISATGCAISIFCLIVTIIVYIILWKYVKCDRSVLHLHMCVVLILAYIVFLSGVDATDNEVACKVVAVLLHFLFLVVFFVMLAEGIELFKTVKFVFVCNSILNILLPITYGLPIVIVAVTLAITKTEGFGTKFTCWLSTEKGLIWAFLGPALLIICINVCILFYVIYTMQQSKSMEAKTLEKRTKSVIRTIIMLSPLLGITWIFGVLSVNDATIAFQYLFAIFNSLQGFFIFMCYCILPHQVRDGFRAMKRKYRARSMDSGSGQGRNSETYTSNTTTRKKSQVSTRTVMTEAPLNNQNVDFTEVSDQALLKNSDRGISSRYDYSNPAFSDSVDHRSTGSDTTFHSPQNSNSNSYAGREQMSTRQFPETYQNDNQYYKSLQHQHTRESLGQEMQNSLPYDDRPYLESLADSRSQGFSASLKEKWHKISRRRRGKDAVKDEIETNRLKEIYGEVNAARPGQQTPANGATNNWQKVRAYARSREKNFFARRLGQTVGNMDAHIEDLSSTTYARKLPGNFSGPGRVGLGGFENNVYYVSRDSRMVPPEPTVDYNSHA